MLGRVKSRVFSLISNNRDSAVVGGLHKISNFIDAAYRNEGSDFETNGERRMLERLAGQNFKIALDIGANVGHWTTAALDAWKACEVHAFEIAPETARKLTEAVGKYLGGQRAKIHSLGLSDQPGSIQMYYFPDDSELTCDAPRHTGKQSVPFLAEVTTLDAFCIQENISQIDFLKIDVEGVEYKVMRGGGEIIRSQKVQCIQFEYGAFSTDSRFMLKDYYNLLKENYYIGKIYPKYIDFRDYNWTMEDFRFCNYVCVLKTRDDLRDLLGRS